MLRRLRLFLLCLSLLSVVVIAHAQDKSITHGPLSGEVSDTSAVLWARGNAAGDILFEIATDAAFSAVFAGQTVATRAEGDFIAEAQISGLTPATAYFYRARLDGGAAVTGQFRTAPAADQAAGFSFTFGACLGGQGYCRNPQTGWKIFDAMSALNPDFFMMVGDGVYIDNTCPVTDNKNVPGAETLATDLTSIRARYHYHLEDAAYAAFLAKTPVFVSWDDHEFRDDAGGQVLAKQNPQLWNDARQAFFENWPVQGDADSAYKLYRKVSYGAMADFFILDTRSYRDPNVNWDPNPRNLNPKTMLGAEQLAWLRDGLQTSQAKWKFIVSSVPLSFPTGFPQPEVDGHDGWAKGADRSGYETELGGILSFILSKQVKNVVFITGDAHWPFAISYDPDRDGVADVYEVSTSPMSGIMLPPPVLGDKSFAVSKTFNPTVLYAEGTFQGDMMNFGQVTIGTDGALNFRVLDKDGVEKYTLSLSAA